MNDTEEKRSGTEVGVRAVLSGCGCGALGAVGSAAYVALTPDPTGRPEYRWVAVIGVFIFGGVAGGVIGFISTLILNLRKSKPKIAGVICLIWSALISTLIYSVYFQPGIKLKDFNPATLSGKGNLAWFTGLSGIALFLFVYGICLVLRKREPREGIKPFNA